MAEVKWIKIVTDIFDDEKVLLIESLPESDGIIVIWFKLLCLAGKNNNSGVFILNEKIPYTDEMFSTIFRRPINTVRLALKTFQDFGMIEVINGAVTIPNWGKHQSLDQLENKKEYMRGYMRDYREKQKQLTDGRSSRKTNSKANVSEADKTRVDQSREEERKERNMPTTSARTFKKPTVEDVAAYCAERGNSINAEKWIDHYTANGWKVGKNPMKDWKAAVRTWERNEFNRDEPRTDQEQGAISKNGRVYR